MFVTEIYASIQGESTWTGMPCTFVRLSGCPLRCRWCDTSYSFKEGQSMSVEDIVTEVQRLQIPLVELTGGEPLSQPETPILIEKLIQKGHKVLIETSGSEPIHHLHPETHIIMDLKCPGSKMEQNNRYENIPHLKKKDELKFVVSNEEDFHWSVEKIREYDLTSKCTVLFSPAWGLVKPDILCQWILASKIPCRLNLQIHKYIWHPTKKGV